MAPAGEIRVAREGLLEAPAERVWPLIDDPQAMGGWFAFADEMELLEGEGLGRRQRLHGHWGQRLSEIDQEVVVYEPGRALGWRHIGERLDGKPAPRFALETVFTITLVPDGARTRVRLETHQQPASRWRGLVIRVFGAREIAARIDESLRRLARVLDVPPPAYAAGG